MNEEDRRMQANERDATTDQPAPAGLQAGPRERLEKGLSDAERQERRETMLSQGTVTSASLSTRSRDSTEMQAVPVSRIPTQRDDGIERHTTAMSRIQTSRSQHSNTVGASLRSRTSRINSTKPLPNFGAGKPFPAALPDREEYVVEFDGPEDPLHAQNWPLKKKFPVAITLGFVCLTAAFGSSIFSASLLSISAQYDISREAGVLGVSLYVLGFATGPILWAPSSELYGRKWPLIVSSFGFSIFSIGGGAAKDIQTIMICRFFSGFFGACPLTVVGAVFADMFNNKERGLAVAVFSMTVFSGPLLAPFVGGFINMSYLGWRWTEYIPAIMGFLGLGLSLIFLEETYPPIILVNKASDLRRRTKNWGIHAKQEEIEVDFRELIEKNLGRPIRMLYQEPIVLALSIYMAFVYGLLYLFLSFYPIVFQEIHGFNEGVGALPFLGIVIGEMLSGVYMIVTAPSYNRKLAANNNMPIPEWRMPPVILGGVTFALGLLWFGWTGYRADIHWIAPTLSGLFTGFGLLTIFLQCLNYLIDSYLMFAASAIAANTFLRSLAGAGFPLFATQMIEGMGVQYAGTLLGCVAGVLVIMPVIFVKYGARIRAKSTFAPSLPMASKANDVPSEDDPEKGEPSA